MLLPLLATTRSGMPSPLRSASCDGAGGEQAGGAVAQRGRLPPAVIDDDAVEALVGVDDVLGAVAREVGHGQRHGLVGLAIGLEGAVAVAQQHQDIAERVADEQVGLAVVVDVGDGQAGGVGAGVDR